MAPAGGARPPARSPGTSRPGRPAATPAAAGDDIAPVLHQVREGGFPPPREVNRTIAPSLEAICLKAMARRPEDRYASARGLADDLEHWLADEPVGAWREPWPERVRRWV